MKLYILLITLFLFTGCDQSAQMSDFIDNKEECPTINCPVVTCPPCEIHVDADDYTYIHFIDVDHGDAILIQQGTTEMLIDCGDNLHGATVVDYLDEHNVTSLEYLMITHPGTSSLGGCDDVLSSINTKTVITNGDTADTYSYEEVVAELDTEQVIIAKEGYSWQIGKADIEIVQAHNELSDFNQNSIVAKLTFQDNSALFTADCDKDCENSLLDKSLNVDILKVSNHGSMYSTSTMLLTLSSPDVAVITVGYGNYYGHPAQETLDRLDQDGIKIYRTDHEGNIVFRLDGDNWRLEDT